MENGKRLKRLNNNDKVCGIKFVSCTKLEFFGIAKGAVVYSRCVKRSVLLPTETLGDSISAVTSLCRSD